jgi:hypothetical protein
MHNPASVEASLIDELEPEPHAIRERPLAAADDDGRDEEFDLVDQAGPEGVRREFVTTDHEILRRSQLHVANGVGVERRLESRLNAVSFSNMPLPKNAWKKSRVSPDRLFPTHG